MAMPEVTPCRDGSITLRWLDNDTYGHVNNVHYYSFFDTVVPNSSRMRADSISAKAPTNGLCAELQCTFSASLSFPGAVRAGLRVGHVGRSSVRYEIALYAEDSDVRAASVTSCMTTSTARPANRPLFPITCGRRSRGLVHE